MAERLREEMESKLNRGGEQRKGLAERTVRCEESGGVRREVTRVRVA